MNFWCTLVAAYEGEAFLLTFQENLALYYILLKVTSES